MQSGRGSRLSVRRERGFNIMEPANNFGLSVIFVHCFVPALPNCVVEQIYRNAFRN